MNTIYNKYKERFIQISGRNRSLFLKDVVKKYSYDIGRLLESRTDAVDDFLEFLWHKRAEFVLMDEKIATKICKASDKETAEVVATVAESSEEESTEIKVKPKAKKPASEGKVAFLEREISSLRYLKREVDEIEKETGRNDLYIGYPFVAGNLTSDIPLRAPLMLFPANLVIEKDEAKIVLDRNQPIILNKTFVLAYSKEKGINAEKVTQEFFPHAEDSPKCVAEVVDYLKSKGFKVALAKPNKKSLSRYEFSDNYNADNLKVENMAVLGRFPLANSIYDDYLALEKDNLSSPSIDLLLRPGEAKKLNKKNKSLARKNKKDRDLFYEIHDLDYAQENALKVIAKENNVVVYGPPGTGKSQTIVNIISDALCKKKTVLVVSQKRAALDVVFNRLGKLNSKAMLIPDPEKDKAKFFERAKEMHERTYGRNYDEAHLKHKKTELNIQSELDILQSISDTLFTRTDFGLTLQEMYAASYNIGDNTKDYDFYNGLKNTGVIRRNYPELSEDMRLIEDKDLAKLYISYDSLIKANEMIPHILPGIDMHHLKEAQSAIAEFLKKPPAPFDNSRYPRSRYLSTFYFEEQADDRRSIGKVAGIIADIEHPTLSKALRFSAFPLLWPAFPFIKMRYDEHRHNIAIDLNIAKHALEQYEEKYEILGRVLDRQGYAMAIAGLLNGNTVLLKKLQTALESYVKIKDMYSALKSLPQGVTEILNFAYCRSDGTLPSFNAELAKVVPIRIYHQIIKSNNFVEVFLSKTVTYEDLRKRIISLKAEQRELSRTLAKDIFSKDYADFYQQAGNTHDFLHNINKGGKFMPIRAMFEHFEDYLLRLFPCWLLSPENVSTILPLKANLFDLIVFDEASQIFIESAIPAIYRGTKVVVAGDNKQLRPTAGFVKRYFGDEGELFDMNLSMRAALEVESLLDLATSRYFPVHLSYHYRSKSAELIDFSNAAFYDNRLQVAPNNIRHVAGEQPIKRIMVQGAWIDRKNHEEASAVVKLVKNLLRDRKHRESIGIVTFNVEQKEYIEDMLDAEALKTPQFAKQLSQEKNRVENGEDLSIFVKNLENVQGEERDIIIFSIGYARNEGDKIVAQFGPLSMDGGENRLNVAITRAKKRIFVVTSVEPEELDRMEQSKNKGPRLLKRYLQYIRAVSNGNQDEVKSVLATLHKERSVIDPIGHYERQMKTALEKLGYVVDMNLGNTKYKLSLAVYDEALKQYVLGVECDYQAFHSADNILERDVYRVKFLESCGWKIVRVWSRDWWLSRAQVLDALVEQIELQKKKIKEQKKNEQNE
ncbi:MAG: AAA domain-containing protein [Firmicutes bacterium]|nr:AAA domain-containing protein [Bacillota bacterium]